jgi:hypothetical protein
MSGPRQPILYRRKRSSLVKRQRVGTRVLSGRAMRRRPLLRQAAVHLASMAFARRLALTVTGPSSNHCMDSGADTPQPLSPSNLKCALAASHRERPLSAYSCRRGSTSRNHPGRLDATPTSFPTPVIISST